VEAAEGAIGKVLTNLLAPPNFKMKASVKLD
jgi:hypothetical protein